MDAVWAPVVAVVVTFAGTAVVPWIRESIDRRREAREAKRIAFDTALETFVLAALAPWDGKERPKEFREAAARLALLLPKDSDHAGRLMMAAHGGFPYSKDDVNALLWWIRGGDE